MQTMAIPDQADQISLQDNQDQKVTLLKEVLKPDLILRQQAAHQVALAVAVAAEVLAVAAAAVVAEVEVTNFR